MKHFLGRHGMKYELEWLEQFILNRLLALFRNNIELTEALLAGCGTELDEEVERIKIRMRRDTIHLGEGYDTTTYVQLYKEALMQLAGLRYAAQADAGNSLTPRMVVLSRLTFEAIENLLLFLETSFAPFFDLNSRVPQIYMEVVSHEARLAADVLADRLKGFAPDPKLLAVVMLPFHLLANSRGDTAYRKVSHLRRLKQELSTLLESTTVSTIDAELRTLLHGINFNFAEFFHYCTSEALRQLAGVEGSVEKQVGILTEFKLYLEGIPVRTEFIFDTDYPPSLRQSLLAWIESRLTDIERSRPAVTMAGTKSGKTKSPGGKMIQMLMSANESGYFIRLFFIRTGLTDKRHFPRLVELFNSNFVSIDGEEMESENLRKKGYPDNVGIGLMRKVRDVLKRMLTIVEDDIANGKE